MAASTTFPTRTAHDRLKASFWPTVYLAIALSAAAHIALFLTARFDITGDYAIARVAELEEIVIQQEFEIPPPPAQVSRPAIPVISADVNISDEITIAPISFGEAAIEGPPPPPVVQEVELSDEPAFTPYEVRPKLSNLAEFQQALLTNYPSRLRAAGIGGVTVLWIYIDEFGEVHNTRVVTTSGYAELDAAAQVAVQQSATFSPALNRDIPVPVWIQMPITFESRG